MDNFEHLRRWALTQRYAHAGMFPESVEAFLHTASGDKISHPDNPYGTDSVEGEVINGIRYQSKYGGQFNEYFHSFYGDGGDCADSLVWLVNMASVKAGIDSPVPMHTGLGRGSYKLALLAEKLDSTRAHLVDNQNIADISTSLLPGNFIIIDWENVHSDGSYTKDGQLINIKYNTISDNNPFHGHAAMILDAEEKGGGWYEIITSDVNLEGGGAYGSNVNTWRYNANTGVIEQQNATALTQVGRHNYHKVAAIIDLPALFGDQAKHINDFMQKQLDKHDQYPTIPLRGDYVFPGAAGIRGTFERALGGYFEVAAYYAAPDLDRAWLDLSRLIPSINFENIIAKDPQNILQTLTNARKQDVELTYDQAKNLTQAIMGKLDTAPANYQHTIKDALASLIEASPLIQQLDFEQFLAQIDNNKALIAPPASSQAIP